MTSPALVRRTVLVVPVGLNIHQIARVSEQESA